MINYFLSFFLLLASPLFGQELRINLDHSPKIVVVGAGLSGLTTAYRLRQQGFHVEVYEARSRVGGRVFSVNVQGHIGELGAQNIADGGEAKNILALIEELGLETESRKALMRPYYYENGRLEDVKVLLQERHFKAEEVRALLERIRSTAHSMKEVLEQLFDGSDLLYKACALALSAYEGAPIDKLSTWYIKTLYHILSGGLSEENAFFAHFWVKGGNGTLTETLSAKLDRHIYLNHILQAISKTEKGSYLLSFQNGDEIEADILILTMPCPVYSDISITDTVIPSERQLAIQNVQYGTNTKILVPISPLEESNGSFTNGRAVLYLNGDCHAINVYYTNYHGLFTEETISDVFEQELPLIKLAYTPLSTEQPVLAADCPFASYERPVGHCWLLDPFAKGSYSCIGPGQELLMTSTTQIGDETVITLFAPLNNTLFFAGEHTSILFDASATMEAAVESGERTARLILQTLSPLLHPVSSSSPLQNDGKSRA